MYHFRKQFRVSRLSLASLGNGGRNNQGRITSYHRGGGSPRRFFQLDLYSSFFGIPGVVVRYEIDCNRRSGYLGLVFFSNGFFSYILAPSNLRLGSFLSFGPSASNTRIGNILCLTSVNQGTSVFNIQSFENFRFTFSRSGGTSCLILIKDSKNQCSVLRFPSGEHRIVHNSCHVTIGSVSNFFHKFETFSSAGQRRRIGRRSVVRGTAMNPVDHPHGGGAGKTSGGRPSVSPWGYITKGKPTINKKKRAINVVRSRKM